MEYDDLKHEYISQIVAIEQKVFSDPWSYAAFERELENPIAHYVIALQNGVVIAYGGFWHILDEGHITNIAVHPEHRRQGVGNALLVKLMAHSKKLSIGRMTLEVRKSNLAAQQLYQKHNFACVGARKGYYRDGEDALIYWTEDKHASGN